MLMTDATVVVSVYAFVYVCNREDGLGLQSQKCRPRTLLPYRSQPRIENYR